MRGDIATVNIVQNKQRDKRGASVATIAEILLSIAKHSQGRALSFPYMRIKWICYVIAQIAVN